MSANTEFPVQPTTCAVCGQPAVWSVPTAERPGALSGFCDAHRPGHAHASATRITPPAFGDLGPAGGTTQAAPPAGQPPAPAPSQGEMTPAAPTVTGDTEGAPQPDPRQAEAAEAARDPAAQTQPNRG